MSQFETRYLYMARKKNKTRADGRVPVTKTIDGQRKFFYGATTKEAEAKRDEFLEDRTLNGYDRPFPPKQFKAVAYEWLAIKEAAVEYTHYKDLSKRVDLLVEYFPKEDIADIKKSQLQKFINQFKGMSESTIKKYLSVIKGIYIYAEGEYIETIPFSSLERPKTARPKEIEFYDAKTMRLLSDYAKVHPKGLLDYIVLHTGTRGQEAIALHIDDFIKGEDEFSDVLLIRRAVKIDDGMQITGDTKSEKSARRIPISREFYDEIASRGFTGFLFDNGNGEPKNLSNARKRYHDVFIEDAAINAFKGKRFAILSLHKIRHSYGTALYEKVRDPYRVMDIMGHVKVDTTRQYVHSEVKAAEGEDVRDLF